MERRSSAAEFVTQQSARIDLLSSQPTVFCSNGASAELHNCRHLCQAPSNGNAQLFIESRKY